MQTIQRQPKNYSNERRRQSGRNPNGNGPRYSARTAAEQSEGVVNVNIGNVDYSISITVTLLVLIGIIMVFSSSYYVASNAGDPFRYFKKQGLIAVIGFCAMFIMSNINYKFLKKLALPIYMVANVLLVLVQFIGEEIGGAKRWINIPIIDQSLQPSEVAKVGIILLISAIISSNKDLLKKWSGFFFCSAIVAVSCALVAWGNLSTAIILAVIGFGTIFIASPYTAVFVAAGGAAAAGLVSFIVFFANDFRSDRVKAWLDPFSYQSTVGYQIIQSLFAVGSGGFFGLGLGQSRQKMGFIPEAHNDIIFSIICEELGFIGAAIILTLFGILIWRGIKVAINAIDLFGSLIASGIVLMIGSQVIINVAVVTNSMPNTGVPLPFISYGGTSLAITMFMMGILLNISRHSKGT